MKLDRVLTAPLAEDRAAVVVVDIKEEAVGVLGSKSLIISSANSQSERGGKVSEP